MKEQFISLLRVSTKKQGDSGLGLEAQRKTVEDFIESKNGELLEEIVEIASGKKKNRESLDKAIKLAKKHGATIITAKLDRCSRRVSVISSLLESNVKFVACDQPSSEPFVLNILACVAQQELKMISERTKAALQAAKARGVVLGENGKKLAAESKLEANERALGLKATIDSIKEAGITTTRGIAARLNAMNIATARGGEWHQTSVQRLMQRLATI